MTAVQTIEAPSIALSEHRLQRALLRGLRAYSQYLQRDATNITEYVRQLTAAPLFETSAEDELRNAEVHLTGALLAVRLSLRAYENLPRVE